MEAGVSKRDTSRARRGQVGPGLSNRKRRHSAKDEDATEHTRKSPRIQERLNKRCHNPEGKVQSQPSRKSPRLQERRDLKQQQITQTGKQTRQSPRTTETRHYTGQEQSQGKRWTPRAPRNFKQHRVSKDKDERQLESSPTIPESQKSVKRRRSIKDGDLSNHDAKLPKHSYIRGQLKSRIGHGKDDYIENWLSGSCWSRRTSTDNEILLKQASDNMFYNTADVLPSLDDSFNGTTSSSRKSEKSAASVHDTDYHQSLRYRNIFIEHENPPVELMRQAEQMISRPRASPDMDDATAKELRDTARRLRNEAEEVIAKQLAPDIIPAMNKIPDSRLTMNSDQPWFNSVPVPLDPSILTNPLPLPRPKPDLAFGYSEAAFTRNQLGTFDLLVDDQSGWSYAVPDKKLRFPFLDIEFKSQAKNGTQYVATNQVATAGAIALNGNLELIQRGLGVESFDFNELGFFSVTMDHELARINVHWVRNPAEGEQYSFHVEGLSKHLLDDANDLRALRRAVKNILEYGADARLRTLCKALDGYREKVILEREAVAPERDEAYRVQAEPQPERRRRSRRVQLPSHEQQGNQSRPDLREEERAFLYAEEDQVDGSQENLQAERRPRRKQTTARQQKGRSRTNVPAKAVRNSFRQASRVVE